MQSSFQGRMDRVIAIFTNFCREYCHWPPKNQFYKGNP